MRRKVGNYSVSHSKRLTRNYLSEHVGDGESSSKVSRMPNAHCYDPLANDPLANDPLANDLYPTSTQLTVTDNSDVDDLNHADENEIELPLVDDDDRFSGLDAGEEYQDMLIDEVEEPSVLVEIREWKMENNVPQNHLSRLLKILKKHHGDPYPADARTLMKTPRSKITPLPMYPGEYYHFGVEQGVLSYSDDFLRILSDIELDIGADGFQFTKSGKRTGNDKPKSVDDFMRPLCEELEGKRMLVGFNSFFLRPRLC